MLFHETPYKFKDILEECTAPVFSFVDHSLLLALLLLLFSTEEAGSTFL
jgi:hypothetical protein